MKVTGQTFFFAGIGGAGMAPLAIYLHQAGGTVVGFDDDLTDPARKQLAAYGIAGETTEIPPEATAVVVSSALDEDHPVRQKARERSLPLYRRGEFLAQVTRAKKLLAVAGSHGKTTTTAYVVEFLRQMRCPFGYILGGFFAPGTLPPARYTDGEWVVAEVDESDGTIADFAPHTLLLVNADWDHPAQYADRQRAVSVFQGLIDRTTDTVITPADLPEDRVTGSAQRVTVGANGCTGVEVAPARQRLRLTGANATDWFATTSWGSFSRRNAALAAAAVQVTQGEVPTCGLERFPGLHRRQEVLATSDDRVVLHDYAHHPTELQALLEGIRERWPEHRLRTVFQPHRPSRTKTFRESFAKVLAGFGEVCLLETYAAGEPVDADGSATAIAQVWPGEARPEVLDPVRNETDRKLLHEWLAAPATEPVLFAWVGAGDIEVLARAWVTKCVAEAKRVPNTIAERLAQAVPTGRFVEQEPLRKKTTVQMGGPARFYAEPGTREELSALIKRAREEELPWFVLGRGSNLVVADEGFSGLVIRLSGEPWEGIHLRSEGRLEVGAGVRLKRICGEAARTGLGGLEFLEGIPGSVGGALRMNAGAMQGWMHDLVVSVDVLTADGAIATVAVDELGGGYRSCRALEDAIALAAVLQVPSTADEAAIRRQIEEYQSKRRASQPREPSAGCLFRNPEGDHAGRLIDACGLKGFRVGSVMVSPQHANFAVNLGGGRAEDLFTLARYIRATVHAETGHVLTPEAILLGADWSEILPPLPSRSPLPKEAACAQR